jgi:hypothetical protein
MVYLYNGMLSRNSKECLLMHATTWINLKIMLSERSQAKNTYYILWFGTVLPIRFMC